MSDGTLFITSIIVFSLMIVGLTLTILEFKYGAPKSQDSLAEKRKRTETQRVRLVIQDQEEAA